MSYEVIKMGCSALVAGMLTEFESERIPWSGPAAIRGPEDLAKMIDHTLLKPAALPGEIDRVCAEALEWGFKSVCVNPCRVQRVAGILRGSCVEVCTVVGFPLGATTTLTKCVETARAVSQGATEIDMVMNQGFAAAGDWESVRRDIASVIDAASGRTVKVIIETCNLDREGIIGACVASALAGASFVKTSTGFGAAGARPEDVALMRLVVGGGLSVKASGGIRTTADAIAMVRAGATRIGASASPAIVSGCPSNEDGY